MLVCKYLTIYIINKSKTFSSFLDDVWNRFKLVFFILMQITSTYCERGRSRTIVEQKGFDSILLLAILSWLKKDLVGKRFVWHKYVTILFKS